MFSGFFRPDTNVAPCARISDALAFVIRSQKSVSVDAESWGFLQENEFILAQITDQYGKPTGCEITVFVESVTDSWASLKFVPGDIDEFWKSRFVEV